MRDLLFCGANRQASLTRLIRAYDDVAAVAEGVRPGSEPVQGSLRVVLIHAERGLGKTRLALELYHHLATKRDPEGYWPDRTEGFADQAAVMPEGERCDLAARPMFLWWGLALLDDRNPGSWLFRSIEPLLVHLTSIRLAAARASSGREAAAELADLAVEAAIELSGDALGLATLKRLGATLWKAGRIVHRHATEATDPMTSASDQMQPLVDLVLDDLARMFAPRSGRFAGRPLVILIDDAQFADRDDALSGFLERLIARAGREGWPLLLLLTHWTSDLQLRQDRSGRTVQPSHVSRILDHARRMAPTSPGPFAAQDGGSLGPECFIEIDLGEPVTDLTPALVDRFPGIACGTVAEIVALSGNNPRKLEQIVAAMTEWPAWFEDGDLDRDLTDEGRREVLGISRLPIDGVVARRYRDAPPQVRRSLTLAGVMGNRFVIEMIDRLSRARLGHPARAGLLEGEFPYRLVRGVATRAEGTSTEAGAFAERLFLDAAITYRRSGQASQDFTSWPSDTELFKDLDALLTDLVRAQPSSDGLTTDEAALALSMAADRFGSGETEELRNLSVAALLKLVGLERGRGNLEGAAATATRLVSLGHVDLARAAAFETNLVITAALTLDRVGSHGQAAGLWRALEAGGGVYASDHPDDDHRLVAANACLHLGDHYRSLSDGQAAYYSYRNALDLASKCSHGHSTARAITASALQRLAEHERIRGRLAEAVSLAGQASNLWLQLVNENPGNDAWRADLASVHAVVAESRKAQGLWELALVARRIEAGIRRGIVEREPIEPDHRAGLARCLAELGDVERTSGDLGKARATLTESREILARLSESDPIDTTVRHHLSFTHRMMSLLAVDEGETLAAVQSLHEGWNFARDLVKLDSRHAPWLVELAMSYGLRGRLRAMGTNTAAASSDYAHCLDLANDVLDRDLMTVTLRQFVGDIYAEVGHLERRMGDDDRAIAFLDAALMNAKMAAMADSSNPLARRKLALSHMRIGDFRRSRDEAEAALVSYRAASEVLLGPQDWPIATRWQQSMKIDLTTIGRAALELEDPDLAMTVFRASLSIAERMTAEAPEEPGWWFEVALSHEGVGAVYQGLGNDEMARESFEKSLEIYRRPWDNQRASDHAVACSALALWRIGSLKGLEGLSDLRAAMGILEAKEAAGNPELHQQGWIDNIRRQIASIEDSG